MQCPTCGNDTPGTLGKCSHCEAPIDVYSAGPVLSAPPPTGTVDAFEDRTMRVPPPAPSWAPETPPPVTPDLAMPPRPQPPPLPPQSQPPSQPLSPQSTAPEPLRLSPEPVDAPTPPATPTPPSTSLDLEDTASWTFNPDEDDASGGFSAPPASAWSGAQPALPAPGPMAPAPSSFGLEPLPGPQESIVPDSWFAQPRKPDAQDADATQIAGPMGFGGDPDHTRMDPGAGMGAGMGTAMGAPPYPGQQPLGQQPPMGTGPMGMGPMGPGPMGPGPMDQGATGQGLVPMGQGSTGLMPMGPGGPGDPTFAGGYPPPNQSRGGPNKPLLAAVAALVTIAVGAVVFVVWPSGDDSSGADPHPTTSNQQVAQKNPIPEETKQQAATLNTLLNDSVDTRRVLAGALGRAGKCKTLPQAIQGFQTVAQRRQNQLNRTRNLKVDKLGKNGERLRTSLTQALTASLQVDQVLLQWAQRNQQNCHGKPRPSAAQVPGRAAGERRATEAKKRFVVLWNPVAKETEQPQRSWKRV